MSNIIQLSNILSNCWLASAVLKWCDVFSWKVWRKSAFYWYSSHVCHKRCKQTTVNRFVITSNIKAYNNLSNSWGNLYKNQQCWRKTHKTNLPKLFTFCFSSVQALIYTGDTGVMMLMSPTHSTALVHFHSLCFPCQYTPYMSTWSLHLYIIPNHRSRVDSWIQQVHM